MADMVRRIVVDVPVEAGEEVTEAITTAVVTAAYQQQPDDRQGWDIFVYATTIDADR
jgi:hypothetical protein